jgi:hypothetical protein
MNCHLFHARGQPCPQLKTAIEVRLALDDVTNLSGGDPTMKQQNREILQKLLRAKQASAGQVVRPPAQPSPQPQPHLSPAPITPQIPPQAQQKQPRLAASEQLEEESKSEDKEGSGPSADPEQQGNG